MIKLNKYIKLSVVIFVLFFCLNAKTNFARAGNISFSVTPPLIKLNIAPGENLSSSIKIVNNNQEPITVYAHVYDFKSKENGGIEFLQNQDVVDLQEAEKVWLSQWLTVNSGGITIPPLQSAEIPYIINVPPSAAPGGHYAAILIGTSPKDKGEGVSVSVSSMVASLIMLSVKGEVREDGQIREFSTDKYFYQDGAVNFKLRFKNLGNVHLQPIGDIKVYNVFNKPQATIPVNQNTDYGNVLPETIRDWDFNWQGEVGLLNMGKYRAEVVLGFGEQARHTEIRSVFFWLIDFKLVGIVFGSIVLIIFLIIFFVKRSIKKALKDAQSQMSADKQTLEKQSTQKNTNTNNAINLRQRK